MNSRWLLTPRQFSERAALLLKTQQRQQLIRRRSGRVRGGEESQGLDHPQPVRQARLLELDTVPQPQLPGLRCRIQTEHPDEAAVRPPQPFDALDGGRLARAVGADHPEDLPPPHLKRGPVHSPNLVVALPQVFHDDRRLHALPFSMQPTIQMAPRGQRLVILDTQASSLLG